MLTDIVRWLKKYFIPHEHNDHRPHILRTQATIAILAVALLVEAGFLAQVFIFSQSGLFATILRNVLIDVTNGSRQNENLVSLTENPLLGIAATMKAEDMAEKGYFAHTSPEGTSPWYWLGKVGYNYRYAGENLAVNFVDSEEVVEAWLNSPAHRQNIMNRRFTEIGIGTATGTYEGRETIFIVQMFGTPILASVAEKLPAVPGPEDIATAESATPATSQEMFVEILGVTDKSAAVIDVESNRAQGEPTPISTPMQRAIASPTTTVNYLYAALMAIISLALILNIIIKVRIQHPKLILNGVIMLLIINSVLLLNHYLTLTSATIF